MITLEDIKSQFLSTTGNYLIDGSEFEEFIGMKDSALIFILKRALATYSKYKPLRRTGVLELVSEKVFNGTNSSGNPEDIPSIIIEIENKSRVWPLHFAMSSVRTMAVPTRSSYYIPKNLWKYSARKLWFAMAAGNYVCSYGVEYPIEVDGSVISLSLEDDRFINLLMAEMMIAIGRSRKNFASKDLPFDMGGAEMASEGESLRSTTIEEIRISSAFQMVF